MWFSMNVSSIVLLEALEWWHRSQSTRALGMGTGFYLAIDAMAEGTASKASMCNWCYELLKAVKYTNWNGQMSLTKMVNMLEKTFITLAKVSEELSKTCKVEYFTTLLLLRDSTPQWQSSLVTMIWWMTLSSPRTPFCWATVVQIMARSAIVVSLLQRGWVRRSLRGCWLPRRSWSMTLTLPRIIFPTRTFGPCLLALARSGTNEHRAAACMANTTSYYYDFNDWGHWQWEDSSPVWSGDIQDGHRACP